MTAQANHTSAVRVTRCEVCDASSLEDVLDLGMHPMCDDIVPLGEDRVCIEYPISIAYCPTCRTAHQKWQVPQRTLFPASYHYRARHTADVLAGMRELVETCEKRSGSLNGVSVLDIGCNDGSLLSIFREKGAKTFGIEPTGAAADAIEAKHTVYNDYLTLRWPSGSCVCTVSRHRDVPQRVCTHRDLDSLAQSVKSCEPDHASSENHYFGAVVDGSSRHFLPEHPRTYSCRPSSHRRDWASTRIFIPGATVATFA